MKYWTGVWKHPELFTPPDVVDWADLEAISILRPLGHPQFIIRSLLATGKIETWTYAGMIKLLHGRIAQALRRIDKPRSVL